MSFSACLQRKRKQHIALTFIYNHIYVMCMARLDGDNKCPKEEDCRKEVYLNWLKFCATDLLLPCHEVQMKYVERD